MSNIVKKLVLRKTASEIEGATTLEYEFRVTHRTLVLKGEDIPTRAEDMRFAVCCTLYSEFRGELVAALHAVRARNFEVAEVLLEGVLTEMFSTENEEDD